MIKNRDAPDPSRSLEQDKVWRGNDGKWQSLTSIGLEHAINLKWFILTHSLDFQTNEILLLGGAIARGNATDEQVERLKRIKRWSSRYYVLTSPFMRALNRHIAKMEN